MKNMNRLRHDFYFLGLGWILLSICLGCTIFLLSCNQQCEPFNFSRIDMNAIHFYDRYSYTDGNDSLVLLYNDKYYTTSTKSYYGVCAPYFEITFSSKEDQLALIYTFNYFRQNRGYTDVIMGLNLLRGSIDLSSDSVKVSTYGKAVLTDFQHYGSPDSSKYIRSAELQQMVVTEFETMDGHVWKLFDLGNEIKIVN
jgi:hypothetical protein